jgi:hypothetical protein
VRWDLSGNVHTFSLFSALSYVKKSLLAILKLLARAIQWLRFAIIPSVLGTAIALLIRDRYKTKAGETTAIIVTAISVIAGILWASYIMRKYGDVDFDAKLMATPELDDRASLQLTGTILLYTKPIILHKPRPLLCALKN